MNSTVSGVFCYAETYKYFVENCRDAHPDNTTNWIVANYYDQKESNYMVKNASNYESSRISGLIFVSNTTITSDKNFSNPKLMAIINVDDGLSLKSVSYDIPNHDLSSMVASMDHKYVNRCSEILDLTGVYDILSLLYLLVTIIALLYNFCMRGENSYTI